jgi:flavodoxin
MKTVIVHDSKYGNTGVIANTIGDALPGDVQVLRSGQANASNLEQVDLLIVGAPTHGGKPSEGVQGFLDQAPANAFAGITVAGFDTRLTAWWVRIFGYAAPKITRALQDKGGTPAGKPGDFFVKGTKGPLVQGETERAAAWAQEIAAGLSKE